MKKCNKDKQQEVRHTGGETHRGETHSLHPGAVVVIKSQHITPGSPLAEYNPIIRTESFMEAVLQVITTSGEKS